ncbi:MAG: inorganic pyrophosphatase [Zetaproteobacteria bacterium CG12_big_fil_rev_8_21_14_0_65_55_1124]|nr:MAG: inorganic pyrophosphatase [Zetaproteobacteria bacterium CG1_02_55_237]PIS18432.1 MAG: inorganic pyrophosphatase [Zetaproteobacteria bacterium CG08_land_8_20_14_0_20_55_17]PIW41808.1 MAG: inorganic pyrophosphatase [Zetaproteobacteria bacterium CG12_big_fil_rev_8_21_14_0_65_55_1124]PIY51437.1 MAG: inorganic pyrophosphatase [Zetaproteobacteria bacterium CG_4_10_14_0_8_um_filter_55_43]PIZ36611.1 MAG: inorganic pyrophosphatase [Zetaproteobacteria bacterium CG_4_10_14_0_2_um_filter_55_20]PJB
MKTFSQWRPHPWHGLESGSEPPRRVQAYIEISPFDMVKFEVDKPSGYLRVDRSVRSSSQHPTLYGFIPRTLCAERVGALMPDAARGDGDPLDICVISERPISRVEILVNARVIGGLPMCDHNEADDKIIAVIEDDPLWSKVSDISELPVAIIDRLMHYFLTYKYEPDKHNNVSIGQPYGYEHAATVIRAAIDDYRDAFGAHLN